MKSNSTKQESLMKKLLDWKSKDVLKVFDEVTLWSAPFGRLLLENMPMRSGATIVDIGFGTGFPLLELSQRFGDKSKIYGIDIWKEAIEKVRSKIEILELKNIEIIEESASSISIVDDKIDLVTSNLGVNNFEEKTKVYDEIRRILKADGRLCITTNPIGTFEELFDIFGAILGEMEMNNEAVELGKYVAHRGTEKSIISEIESSGFKFIKRKFDTTTIRFVDAMSLLDHSLIRIGFRAYWEELVGGEKRAEFIERLLVKIEKIIAKNGEFRISIPMLYLEFGK